MRVLHAWLRHGLGSLLQRHVCFFLGNGPHRNIPASSTANLNVRKSKVATVRFNSKNFMNLRGVSVMELCPTGLRCLNVHALIEWKDSMAQESTVHNPSVSSPTLLNTGSISVLPAAASTIPVLAGYRGGSLRSAVPISYAKCPR
jgi:hypothetical protein